MSEQKKLIIVSGGSKGLGKGMVQGLLEAGYRVATFSRTKTEFIKSIESSSHANNFSFESIDATDFDKVNAYLKQIYQAYGQIDALINNAGMAVDGVLTMMKPSDINKLLTLNLESSIRVTQTCAKLMLPKKSGSIINISSIIGLRGYSGLAVYSATKAGLDGFTRALARELGPRMIRVNSIAPGYLDTELSSSLSTEQRGQIIRRTPLGRLGKVEDVLGLTKFLLSPEAEFITGHTFVVDGGITC
jgi:3-oxoacyl-[acyl-carrier protein] reductase